MGATALRLSQKIWGYLRTAYGFYWTHRGDLRIGLRRWMLQFLPALEDPDRVRREIRVPLREAGRVTLEEGIWKVSLPNRCIVCGGRGSQTTVAPERELIDPFPLLAALCAAGAFAIAFGWWYHSLLLFLVILAAGPLVGHQLRRFERIQVSFAKCRHHAATERTPDVELWRGDLLLWTGAREVRQAFLGDFVEEVGPDDDAPYVPPDLTPPPPPETLALADEVPESSQIVHESPERMPPLEDLSDLFGPSDERLDRGDSEEARRSADRKPPADPSAPGPDAGGNDDPDPQGAAKR